MYGAIAIDSVTGSGGGKASSAEGYSQAKKIALEQCGSVKGVEAKDCTIAITFKNACATIASLPEKDSKGNVVWSSGVGANKQEALNKALVACDAKASKLGVSRPEPCGMWINAFCAIDDSY